MTAQDDPSGAALAQQAYDAGAVEPPVRTPRYDVVLHFTVESPAPSRAQALADGIVTDLVGRSSVRDVDYTVTERTPA